MMKKVFAVGIIAILATISLTGCNWFQTKEENTEDKPAVEETVKDETADEGTENAGVADLSVQDIKKLVEDFDSYEELEADDLQLSCTNDAQKASFQAAVDSGVMKLELNNTPHTNLTVYATGNPEGLTTEEFRVLFTPCIDGVGASAPQKALDDHLLWSYLSCTGGAKVSSKEADRDYAECESVRTMLDTYLHTQYGEFELEGTYEATIGMVHDFSFVAEDGRFMKFTNGTDELFEMFNLAGETCADCEGTTTIKVKNLKLNPGPGESTYETTLLEVVEASEPTEISTATE